MSNTRLFLAAILACLLSAGAVYAADTAAEAAQAEPQVLLDAIRANRKALVAVNLALSPEESAKFWPLYDRYQAEINPIGDRVLATGEGPSKREASRQAAELALVALREQS